MIFRKYLSQEHWNETWTLSKLWIQRLNMIKTWRGLIGKFKTVISMRMITLMSMIMLMRTKINIKVNIKVYIMIEMIMKI